MNTIESNKLIAEFMGITPRLESPDVYSYSDQPFFTVREYTAEAVMSAIAGYVKYHSSYDWLMPVVEKIESLRFDHGWMQTNIYGNFCKFNHSHNGAIYFWSGNPIPSITKIEAIYITVTQFIQWYNKQNKD